MLDPTSGPLHLLFLLPGTQFPQVVLITQASLRYFARLPHWNVNYMWLLYVQHSTGLGTE